MSDDRFGEVDETEETGAPLMGDEDDDIDDEGEDEDPLNNGFTEIDPEETF